MKALRTVAAVAWFSILAAVAAYVYQGGTLFEDIKQFVMLYPEYSFLLFLMAYCVRPLLLVPDSWMLVIGGLTFGPWIGFLGGYVGENISASIAFWLSRFLGETWVSHSHVKFVKKLDAAVNKHGYQMLVFLRFIPVAPFDGINYGAGLTSMRYHTFVAGTALGVVPALSLYVLLGSSLTHPHHLVVAAIILVFVCVKIYSMRRVAPELYDLVWHHGRRH